MEFRSVFKACRPLTKPTPSDLFPTFTLSLFLLVLLQLWLPYFFLTSDNLTQFFPVWTEWGRHLLAGESPLESRYLLGGNYPLYKDPSYLSCFHPVVSVVSLLAESPARFAIIDIFASLEILSSCLALAFLLSLLNRRGMLQLQRWQITALALSYGFSGYNLIIGSLWITYLSNQVAIPLYFAALLFKNRRWAILCIAVAGTHAFLGGVPSSYLFILVVCSFAILVKSMRDKNAESFFRWMSGQALAGLLLSPLLYFSIRGFLGSVRNEAPAFLLSQVFDVPVLTLAGGWFLSGMAGFFARDFSLFYMPLGLACTIFGAACSWWLLIWLFPRKNRLPLFSLEWAAWSAVIVLIFLIVRPAWVTAVLGYVPFLRSTRWPFREMLILIFFLHLLIGFRLGCITKIWQVRLLIPGTLVFAISLFVFLPPTFQFNPLDREMLFSGRAEEYWSRVKKENPPQTIYISVFDSAQIIKEPKEVSLLLLGAHNFSAFLEIKALTGYSTTAPAAALPLQDMIANCRGYFEPFEFEAAQKYFQGSLTPIRQLSIDPIQMQIDGKTTVIESKLVPDGSNIPAIEIRTREKQ